MVEFSNLNCPLAHPVPYLPKTLLTLYLNTFRGEPAISRFVWHFTPTHSSSQHFVPYTGSVLHSDIIGASTWPWVAHPVSGLIQTTPQTLVERPPPVSLLHPASARRSELPPNSEAPPVAITPPAWRPIRTCFRFGSRTSIP